MIDWSVATGAGRRIVQAYRQKRAAGDSHVGVMLEAYATTKEAGRKSDGLIPAVELIIRWAQDNHAEMVLSFSGGGPANRVVGPAGQAFQNCHSASTSGAAGARSA